MCSSAQQSSCSGNLRFAFSRVPLPYPPYYCYIPPGYVRRLFFFQYPRVVYHWWLLPPLLRKNATSFLLCRGSPTPMSLVDPPCPMIRPLANFIVTDMS